MLRKWERVINYFFDPIALGALVILIPGAVSVCRRDRADVLYWPGAMLGVALVLSALRKYPFTSRLLAYGIPACVLLFAAGLLVVSDWMSRWRKPAGIVFTVLMLLSFGGRSLYVHLIRNADEEFRPVYREMVAQSKPGDALFVYRCADDAYGFYGGGEFDTVIMGKVGKDNELDRASLRAELDEGIRHGGRMWFIFSHYGRHEYDGRAEARDYLDSKVARLATIEAPGCSAYLYDLDAAPDSGDQPRANGRPAAVQ